VNRLTPFAVDRTLNRHQNKLGKWGSAVQIGRGPATVIGRNAVSQATLPSYDGRVSFARENAAATIGPAFSWGFFIDPSLSR
jgi:hypothetical protein